MSERGRVVELARGWIGTPYRHQASCLQGGTDCLGLIRGLWRSLYGAEPEPTPHYSADWAEAAGEEALWQAALRHLEPVPSETALLAGQILLFRMAPRAIAKHLGIVAQTEPARFIHAYSGHGVVDSALSRPWRARVVARFDFPEMR